MSRAALFLLASVLASIPRAAAAQSPPSDLFQVDSDNSSGQRAPAVAIRDDGAFVVVWWSSILPAVVGQRYDRTGRRAGAAFVVDYTEGIVYSFPSSAAMDRDGDFVVAWTGTGFEAFWRRFDRDGVPQGDAVALGDGYGGAGVASNPGGDFVVVWSSYGGQVSGQLYDAGGQIVRSEFAVDDRPTVGLQPSGFGPAVAMDASSDFVVVWTSRTGSASDVVGQRFDPSGAKVGSQFRVNSHTLGSQFAPAVASAANGSFVVVWTSQNQDGDDDGVFAQRYDAGGMPAGGELQVNTITEGPQWGASVAMGDRGDFFVSWTSGHDAAGESVRAQRFAAGGQRLGGEVRIDGGGRFNRESDAARGANGTLVVAWETAEQGQFFDIFARRFAGGGSPTGDADGDGLGDGADNCPTVFNPQQTDVNADGYGDDCVSPDASISPTARLGANPIIGRGTFIADGVTIGDDATLGELVRLDRGVRAGRNLDADDFVSIARRVTLGDDVIVGFATRIEAAAVIGDGVTIGDRVVIKRNVMVGAGATIEPLVVLFPGARIGAGATVEIGARVGKGATVSPGALVPAGTTVPAGATFP